MTNQAARFVKVQKAAYSRCLAPSMDCEEAAIRAHSIQNSRILELLQSEQYGMMPDKTFNRRI